MYTVDSCFKIRVEVLKYSVSYRLFLELASVGKKGVTRSFVTGSMSVKFELMVGGLGIGLGLYG